jgi:hypothetical protein
VLAAEGRPAEEEGRAAGSSAAAAAQEVGVVSSASLVTAGLSEENHPLATEVEANPRCWRCELRKARAEEGQGEGRNEVRRRRDGTVEGRAL